MAEFRFCRMCSRQVFGKDEDCEHHRGSTLEEAKRYGLFKCETCGLPPNNHFGYTGPCAHDPSCRRFKGYFICGKDLRCKTKKKRKSVSSEKNTPAKKHTPIQGALRPSATERSEPFSSKN
jgi:hypothetical protein